jgi:SRSO17 transposase
MLQDIAKQKQIPFRYVLADSLYANSPEFVEAVESQVGLTYLLQVPEDTLCWLKSPCTITKTYKYNGQVRTKKILSHKAKDPISIKSLAAGINSFFH